MRAALDSDELFVEYQPIVLLSDASCIGAEALVRWRRADTILQPSEFLRAINNTPLSGRLTYWVMDTIAAELGDWLDQHPYVQVSINVPPEILGRGGLHYAAERSGLQARVNQIVFEVTEHGVPDQLGLQALNMMAERGLRVALDDVSLNSVNLALLARCNFSVIKLDRQLTAQLAANVPPPHWLAALGSLLRNTGLKVVAEGVETDYQATVLHATGVQMAQGFFFSASLSAPELIAYHASTS
ncbi:MAG TPA: EAL domain-containing protein [Steroidobacteraceae bacterium]|jgi:sensor c-di-GMP phosphodiesterase-like protein|nr:EAL domain-containing protein [Steroidobacteraceae bacterium]